MMLLRRQPCSRTVVVWSLTLIGMPLIASLGAAHGLSKVSLTDYSRPQSLKEGLQKICNSSTKQVEFAVLGWDGKLVRVERS